MSLEYGTKTELEEHGHLIGNSVEKAREIARDHLRERADYYEGIKVMEGKPLGYWGTYAMKRLVAIACLAALFVVLLAYVEGAPMFFGLALLAYLLYFVVV